MVLFSNKAKMHIKLIDTLELIIKKKTEEIENKGQNKEQKAIALNRRRLLFGFLSKMRTIVLRPCQPQLA